MSLKDKAIAAYMEKQEYEKEKEIKLAEKRAKATEKDFQDRFGEHVSVEPSIFGTFLTEDGLRFRANFESCWSMVPEYFELWGECPNCGEKCPSRPIFTLRDLGEQIKAFETTYRHHCTPKYHKATTEERLLGALRDFVYELQNPYADVIPE